MDKRFLIVVAVVLAGFGYLLTSSKKEATDNNSSTAVSEHVRGAGNKKVELIEYGDFQCPVCGGYFPIIEQVIAKYGDDIKFVFRNFPLDSIHQNARAGHRAAEAAGKQDKFFEMYSLLYQRQQDWSSMDNPIPTLEKYAEELNLDLTKFKSDYASETVNNTINADIKAGQELKITGTPGLVVNGKLIENPRRDVESFSTIIDAAIADAAKASSDASPAPTPSISPTPSATPVQ